MVNVLEGRFIRLCRKLLLKDVYGVGRLTFTVQDGVIQNISSSVEYHDTPASPSGVGLRRSEGRG
jgi:hypothetical protein